MRSRLLDGAREVTPDFKHPVRHVATREEWERIILAKSGPCRGCGGKAESFHHLVPKSLRGDDVEANVVPLCGSGTTGCHGALETHPAGWEQIAAAVRHSLTPLERQYVAAKKGVKWLDRYLPAGEHDLCARCRKPKTPTTSSAPRRRRTWSVKVPADEQENGCELLDGLVEQCRAELIRRGVTDSPELPGYYVLVPVLADWLGG